MYYSTLTSKGQTTIPAEIRQLFHLEPGDRLEFICNQDTITIVPINNSIKNLKGLLPKPKKALSVETMNDIIKGKTK